MKLTEKSNEVYEYLKKNGEVSMEELVTVTGRISSSINASVVDLERKGLATRRKEAIEGKDKPATYFSLTPEGLEFVPTEE